MGYTLSPKARADLDAIWDYTAERWGEDQADAYVRGIAKVFADLADGSLPGRRADNIRSGYRKQAAGSHVVFYRQDAGRNLLVVRVLHRRMDVERHL